MSDDLRRERGTPHALVAKAIVENDPFKEMTPNELATAVIDALRAVATERVWELFMNDEVDVQDGLDLVVPAIVNAVFGEKDDD